MKIHLSIMALALALASQASAQQIYKCADGVYQQEPCAGNAKPQAVIGYTPVPDAPRDYSNRSSQNFEFRDAQSDPRQYSQPRQSSSAAIANPYAPKEPSLQDRLSSIASDPAYRGSPSARRAAMNAAMQESGYQSSGPYQAPRAPSPTDGIGRPARVIDDRTGQPINGAIKVAPNRIWDPATGKYYDTY